MQTATGDPPSHALILSTMGRIDRAWTHRSRLQRLRVFLDAVDQLRASSDDQLEFNVQASRLKSKLAL